MNTISYQIEYRGGPTSRLCALSALQRAPADCRGVTLVELMIVMAIAVIMSFIAVPVYSDCIDSARLATVQGDMGMIELRLERFCSDSGGALPPTLTALPNVPADPWGNPYENFNIEDGPPGKANLQKDKNVNPLNSDYDLYSKGKDGDSKLALSPKVSHDDIIRANNGAYIGYAVDY